ncbi:type II toxin-antitoxin system RelE/ParE family toxin [Taklimakanibacter lacteus]|uniref:type II toxin-antitoxin system RelE/ParE family toxin n=1 Tax=Taklimakanibacter lacteus TaxID=2268456 RepID=UPI000E675B05
MGRQVVFLGSTQEDLQEWPDEARREAGHQLWLVQNDREPTDWKPMPSVGPGAREIRIQENGGQWRVLYVAKIRGLVHVLHVFNKKTQQTSQRDVNLGKSRYRSI